MLFRKTFFGREIELGNVQLFLVLLIALNFLFISFMLFTHPIPQYIHPDSQEHYKWTELIKKDLRYVGYRDYPKGFHLISAALSYAMPVGTAMALIVSLSVALLLLFSYKLAFLVSNNKTLSILTALFVSVINFNTGINALSTPVPQTIALALLVTASYFFLKKEWMKTGLTVGIYAWMHASFLLPIGLFFLMGFYWLLKEKQIEWLKTSAKALLVTLILFIPLRILLTVFASGAENSAFDPKISFYEEMVSPLSFFLLEPSVTAPPLIIILSLIGIYVFRGKILSEEKHFFLFLGFAVPVVFSQLYWIALIQVPLFLGSRTLFFALFPLAFFTAKGTIKFLEWIDTKPPENVVPGIMVFSLILLFFSVNSGLEKFRVIDTMASLENEDMELVSFLQTKPVDEVVASPGTPQSFIPVLGLKRNTSQRNFWLIIANKDPSKLLDLEKIDYVLIPLHKEGPSSLLSPYSGEEKKQLINPEEMKHTKKVFENKKYVLLKVNEEVKFKKTDSLKDSTIALVALINELYKGAGPMSLPSPYTVMLFAEDREETVCVLIEKEMRVLDLCPEKAGLVVKGKKADLMKGMNSADFAILKTKFTYLFNQGKVSFEPTKTPFTEEDLSYVFCVNSRTTPAPRSNPNQWIMGWLCHGLKK